GMGGTTYTYDGKAVTENDTVETIHGEKLVKDIIKGNSDYKLYVATGMNAWISERVNEAVISSKQGITSLALYMVVLLITLVAMAVFRSPAVALMPDVTPKPLRSQGNAMINLMGGIGGAIAFLIYTVALIFESLNTYAIIFGAVGCGMIVLLVCFMLLVNEKKMVEGCRQICEEFHVTDEDEEKEELQKIDEEIAELPNELVCQTEAGKNADGEAAAKAEAPKKRLSFTEKMERRFNEKYKDLSPEERKAKLEKAKFTSFILILASIFMWFMGYNAVSSNLSVYCVKALNLKASVASIISGVSMGVSAIAFIPVGYLAAKIGRRKSIMIGFAMAVVSFILILAFVLPNEKQIIPAVLFALFYLIAGFGLIIANVNTFPMVVELAKAEDCGKYTGFYYTATMSAQAITPFIAGLVMDGVGMKFLFLYSAICVFIAIVLMFFVRYGDSMQIQKGKKLTKEEKRQIRLDSMDSAD
ncbi:MAG: MFS transporter, partial [Firmicutes bacterium]|nr:MFS transporter [Bacillota bacterium]